MHSARNPLWWLLVGVVAIVLVRPVRAEPPIAHPKSAEALAHLQEGNRLYAVQRFQDAAAEYKKGALVEPAPIFDYNLGQAYRQSGDYKSAIWYYRRFLDQDSTPGARTDAVNKFIADMKAELDRQAMKEPPTEPESEATTPKPAPSPAALPSPPLAVAAEAPTEHWYQDGFGWGLAGTGLVGSIVGGGLLLDAASLNNDANHSTDQQEASALHDKADTRTLLGGVIGAVGVGLLVTGAIKLAIHPSASGHGAATAWNLAVTRNGIAIMGQW